MLGATYVDFESWIFHTMHRDLPGVPIVLSPHVKDGTMYATPTLILVGTAPLTPAEQASRDNRNAARAIIREVLADELAWLGTTCSDLGGHETMLEALRGA